MSENKNSSAYISHELDHLKEYEQLVAGQLLQNAGTHNDARDGFTPLDHDPTLIQRPYQDIRCVSVSGNNADAETLRNLASTIYPGADRVIEAYKQRPDLLNHIYDTFARGDDVDALTDHRNVINVAIGGGALVCALYEEGLVSPADIRTSIFASAMIKYTQLLGSMPTVEVLQDIFSETNFTLPPSKTIRGTEIPKVVRTDFNEASINHFLEEDADKKPKLTMIAGSGSRDLLVMKSFGRRRVYMGPLAFGTAKILSRFYTLPIGLDIADEKPQLFIGKLHRPIQTDMEAHGLMAGIATGMTESTGVQHRYYMTREELEDELAVKNTKVGWR